MLASDRPRFRSLEAELQLFSSDTWLRGLVSYFMDWYLCIDFRSIESNKRVLYDRL